MATVTVNPVAATILSALIAAAPGDTILVRPGVVTGQISRTTTLDKRGSGGVTIKAEIPNNPPRFTGSPRMLDLRNVHGVRFEKLTFERKLFDSAGFTDGGGVDLQTCNDLTFYDCTFDGGLGQLYAMACPNFVVEYCNFQNFGAKPLRLYGNCANATVRHNKYRLFAGDPARLNESARSARVITVALTSATTETPPSGVRIYNNEIVIAEPGLRDVMGIVAWSPLAVNDATLATYGHRNLEIYGNYIEGGALQGIHINKSLSGITIRDNALVKTPYDGTIDFPRVYISNDSFRLLQKGQTITNNSSGLGVGPGTPLVNGSVVGHRTPDTQRPLNWVQPATGPGAHTATQLDPAPAQLVEPTHVAVSATYTAGTFGGVVYYSALVAVPDTSLAWRADPSEMLLRWTDDAIGPMGRRLEYVETIGTTHYYRMVNGAGSATEHARPVGDVEHDGLYFSYREAAKNNWSLWSAYTDSYTTPTAAGEVQGVVEGGSEVIGDAQTTRDAKAAAGAIVGAATVAGSAHALSSTGGVVGVARGGATLAGTAQRVANAFAGAGDAAGAGVVAGQARLVGRVTAALVGSGSCAGSASVVETFAEAAGGEIAGAATVSGSVTRTRQAAGGAVGAAALAGPAVRVRQAVGVTVGAGEAVALARRVRSTAGQATGEAVASGRAGKPGAEVAGDVLGGSTVTGQAGRTRQAAGGVVAGSTVAGRAMRFRLARGVAVGQSDVLVAGDRAFRVSGSVLGGSAVLGRARVPHPLFSIGAVRGSSALSGQPSATFSVRARSVGGAILAAVLARRTRSASGHAVGGSTLAQASGARATLARGAAVGRSRVRGVSCRVAGADLLVLVDLPTEREIRASITLPRPLEETWQAIGAAVGGAELAVVATSQVPVNGAAVGRAVAQARAITVMTAQGAAEAAGHTWADASTVKMVHGQAIGGSVGSAEVGSQLRGAATLVGASVAEATPSKVFGARGAAVGGSVADASERVAGTASAKGRAVGETVVTLTGRRVRRAAVAAVGAAVSTGEVERTRRTGAAAAGGSIAAARTIRIVRASGAAAGGSAMVVAGGGAVGAVGVVEGGAEATAIARRTRAASTVAAGAAQVAGSVSRVVSASGAAVGGAVVVSIGTRAGFLIDKISNEVLFDKISNTELDYIGAGVPYGAQGNIVGGATVTGRIGSVRRVSGTAVGGAVATGSSDAQALLLDKVSNQVLQDKISGENLAAKAA